MDMTMSKQKLHWFTTHNFFNYSTEKKKTIQQTCVFKLKGSVIKFETPMNMQIQSALNKHNGTKIDQYNELHVHQSNSTPHD